MAAAARGVTPVLLSWSGGKDSCVALWELQRAGHAVTLLTTINDDHDRISMHGVRTALLERQAAALGLAVDRVLIPTGASNTRYEAEMGAALRRHADAGIRTVAFGDLFLADIRAYRERMVAPFGLDAVFPVWGRETRGFVRDFIAIGFRAVVVCVDLAVLDLSFAGRMLDAAFLADLPPGVDPCGENGEFHTFVFDGPTFTAPMPITTGERVARDGFGFCDLLPGD